MRLPPSRAWLSAALGLLFLLVTSGIPGSGAAWQLPVQAVAVAADAESGCTGTSDCLLGDRQADRLATLTENPRVVTKAPSDRDGAGGILPAGVELIQAPRFTRRLPPAFAPPLPGRLTHPGSPRGPPRVA